MVDQLILIENNVSQFYENCETSHDHIKAIKSDVIKYKSKYKELYKTYKTFEGTIDISNINTIKVYIERCYNGSIDLSLTLATIDGIDPALFDDHESFYKNKFNNLNKILTSLKQNFID